MTAFCGPDEDFGRPVGEGLDTLTGAARSTSSPVDRDARLRRLNMRILPSTF